MGVDAVETEVKKAPGGRPLIIPDVKRKGKIG
jgi:hypothetical protein